MSWILAAAVYAGAFFVQDAPQNPPPQPPATTTTPGQAPQQQPADPMGGIMSLMIPLAICFFIIYFMMIRPQKRQMKERETMLESIRKKDEVITTAGIIGTVARIKDQELELVIDSKHDVRIRVLKSAVMKINAKTDSEDEAEKKEDAKETESEGSKQG